MIDVLASLFWAILGVYAAVGTLFLLPFHRYVVHRLDDQATGATWGFRIAITPGLVALWPIILIKWRAMPDAGGPQVSDSGLLTPIRIRRLQSYVLCAVFVISALVFILAIIARAGMSEIGKSTDIPGVTESQQ